MLRVFSSDAYVVPLPEGHRFPIEKYRRLRASLLADGVLRPDQVHTPALATRTQLGRVHTTGYLDAVFEGCLSARALRKLGFPWSSQLVERSRASAGGTIHAALAALEARAAGNLTGGTHHAHAGFGSGYCVFNDVAVAIRELRARALIRRALVVDLDVHQGDGTARACAGDPEAFTLSLHGAKNFPFQKAESDLDVPLDDGTGDEAYLAALDRALPEAFARARPEIVFYLAGSDPLHNDRLGRLGLTLEGLKARDARVISLCLGERVPLVLTMSGGYAEPIDDSVTAHANTYRVLSAFLNER